MRALRLATSLPGRVEAGHRSLVTYQKTNQIILEDIETCVALQVVTFFL
jgi:hypothetical protein